MYPYDFFIGGVIDGTVLVPVVLGGGLGIESVTRVAGRAVGSYRVVFDQAIPPENIPLSFCAEVAAGFGPVNVVAKRTGVVGEVDVIEFHANDQAGNPVDTKVHVTCHRARIHFPP